MPNPLATVTPLAASAPPDWERVRLKYTVRGCRNGIWGEEATGGDDLLCVRVADFDRLTGRVRLDDPTYRSVARSLRSGRVLKRGDLLLEKSGGGATQPVGAVVLYDHSDPAVCSNFVALMQVASNCEPRFLCYVHATLYAIGINTRSIKQTTGIQNLDSASYLDEVIAIPPLKDQQAIADFLDEKTAAIDALIAKKERLIDLIEEKRQGAITRAVTKGLDLGVPRKDSGVEWLGEVPAHWDVLPVRRVAHFVGGTGFPHAYQGQAEGSYPFFKVEDMNSKGNGWILTKAANYVSEAVSRELRATICPAGGVVFAKVGAALLKNRRRVLGQASIIDNNMLAAVPTGVRTEYFAHALGLVDFGELRRPGPVPSITGGDVGSIPIPIPPLSEQSVIEEHLDELRRRNRSMVRLISVQVGRLREYRQTLISAAVTGQTDVRSRATSAGELLEEATA